MTKKPTNAAVPSILDAVEDQFHDRWIKFGTSDRSLWFSVRELQSSAAEVFGRLSRVGKTCLTEPTKHAFKSLVEEHVGFRPSLVAARPGWIENCYVFGDGTKCTPPGDNREVIAAFQRNPKFEPRGSLEGWQSELGPLVGDQFYALFAIYLALVGPLLRFAPPDFINTVFEMVGPANCGKTTVAVVAASTAAGNIDNHVGGGETWDLTLAALDPLREAHCDSFLFLDEGNLIGSDPRKAQELLGKAVFKLAGSGQKLRFGDVGISEQINLATLSTSNTRLAALVRATPDVMAALQSRMITLEISEERAHGVLSSLPPGFAKAEDAIREMRAAANHNYGHATRHFVQQLALAAADESALRDRVGARLRKFESHRVLKGFSGSPRVRKAFAIVYTAGWLATKYGTLPSDWKAPMQVVTEAFREYQSGGASTDQRQDPLDAHAQVLAYVQKGALRAVEDLQVGVSGTELSTSNGFLRGSGKGRELLISAERFNQEFAKARDVLKDLRSRGLMRCEDGKLTIKAPRKLCSEGRVHCIHLNIAGSG